jgi:hypothetical protein
MISIERSSGWGVKAAVSGLVLVVLGAAFWLFTSPDESSTQAPQAAASVASMPPAMAEMPQAASLEEPASEMTDTAALGQAMSSQSDGQAQLNRVVKFLKFQREFEKWQGMQGDGDLAVRTALGQKLLTNLPEHIANSSMTLPEGEFVCGMILSDIESNEALRDSNIQACQAQLKTVAPKMDSAQEMKKVECESDYRSREATLVAAFQALPSSQRDPAKLQADLDKARRDVFDAPNCKL